jgi:superoxide reductase
MAELTPNTADAAAEKHVPVAVREGNKLTVTVGAAAHPMTGEHHIAWIAAADGENTQRAALPDTGAPQAEFFVGGAPAAVYAYCNLHGLWRTEVK